MESGIRTVLRESQAQRQFEFDVERAIYLTVLHRFFSPGSNWAAETWRENYSIPGSEELNLHRLYRAMVWEWAEIIRGLNHLSEVTLSFQSKSMPCAVNSLARPALAP